MPFPDPILCEAVVLRQERLAPGVFWMVLGVDASFPECVPGQFLFLRVSETCDPLLRRPMSVFHFEKDGGGGRLEILYRVVGRGTSLLSAGRPRDSVSVLGPLGNGFEPIQAGSRPRLLIGGGVGVAPLVFFSRRLRGQDLLVLGCSTREDLPLDFLRERSGVPLEVATEDGSAGVRGLASEVALRAAEERRWDVDLSAAGPVPMLGAVAAMSRARGLRCEVSLEARMACGLGSCQGCVVPVEGGDPYRRVCRDGPVFDARAVRWEALR